jgi:hypothetical protein
MMKPLDLRYQKINCVQTSVYCTTLKIQSRSGTKHVSILVINPELAGEGLLYHTGKNLDTFQSQIFTSSLIFVLMLTLRN